MNNNFAFNLKHLRLEKGLTQEQLGKLINKDYSTIGKWENGTRSPIMEDVIKLSNILDVDIKDLINKDYEIDNSPKFDELDILFSKNKDILTDEDKEYMRFIIEKRKREIDKQLGDREWVRLKKCLFG